MKRISRSFLKIRIRFISKIFAFAGAGVFFVSCGQNVQETDVDTGDTISVTHDDTLLSDDEDTLQVTPEEIPVEEPPKDKPVIIDVPKDPPATKYGVFFDSDEL